MADSIQRAVELFHERNMDEAKAMCMRLLAADERNVDCLNLLGIITGRFEQDPAGIEHIYKAIKLAPERADLRHNLGGILGQFGQRAAACESFQQAIDRNNFYGEAWQGLAESTKGTPPREYVKKLEQIVATPDLSSDQVCYLNFALARFLENACEYDRSFKHYVIANKAKSTQFDWQDHDHWVQSTRRIFTQELFERMGSVGSSSRRPVFVIGMPRSGTSLVEQIIASHPEVHGAGELPDMNSIARTTSNYTKSGALYPESIAELPQEAILGMGRAYLDRISGMAPRTAVRVVDKHPLNFRLVGLIRLLFPYSTIIHCARDPLDTCLSCYFQNFSHGQA